MSGTTSYSSPSQTTDDVNAIINGMSRAPPVLDPNYRPPMPTAIQPRSAPASAFGTGAFGSAQPQSWPVPPSGGYGNAPAPPPPRSAGQDAASGLTPLPYSNQPPTPTPPTATPPTPPGTQVAANRPIVPPVTQPPPRFQQGNQPGPWPAAFPNSPQIDPARAPALPGETPQETADLNRHMAHESQGQNIINSVAAKNPELYFDPKAPRTASGYWQMVNGTWATAARLAGVDTRQYPTAMSAPYGVQRQVALALYRAKGNAPWAPTADADDHADSFALRQQGGLSPYPRESNEWGRAVFQDAPARNFGAGPQGAGPGGFGQPPQNTIAHTLGVLAPLLVGIASLAMRLPLSTAITAYGAMARAQQNGQREDYERNRTLMRDKLAESTAQQTMESRDASDAFAEYGNNPEGLQRALAQVALKYNDPAMFQMAEQGRLNDIYQMQQKRDLYNQGLEKGNKAAQAEQDQRDLNADVAARDRQWAQEHPNATPDQAAIAHEQNVGLASADQYGPSGKGGAGAGEGETVHNVLDKDNKPTGKQVRLNRNGGVSDLNGQPTTIDTANGEHLDQGGKAGADTLEATKPYDVVDKDGKVLRTVLGRERKDQPGILDSQTGQPIQLGPGEQLQPHVRPSATADNLETSKPYDIVDKDGHVVQPNVMLREARNKAGYVHSEDGSPLVLQPGQRVKQITPTTSGGGRAGAQVLRQLVGGREVLSDLQNVVRLPIGTTIGPLGTAHPGPTIVDALTGDLARKLTDQDSQLMQASMASMSRELSILMSPVYGGNWAAQQIDPLIPKSGDTISTTIFKMSRLAQSADNALEAASKSPTLSNEEQAYAAELRKQIKEAIPWSTSEAMDFAYRGHPKESFGDYVKRQGISGGGGGQGGQGGSDTPKPPTGLPSGSQWSPSRRQWRDPSGKLYDETGKPL